MDRQLFAKRQAEMTERWYEEVKRREGDVDAYIRKRQRAYLDRWQEACRFIPRGATVLDIGGGNLYAELLEYFKRQDFDYWFIDVDEGAVDGSRRLATSMGFTPAQFSCGFNDKLSYDDAKFDAVFSSHCIEHSYDLRSTLLEINRILVPGGNLLMAVPFGWEENPEHPYFFGPDEWIALIEDAGFEIRVAQFGQEYPESGFDFFIAARKKGEITRSRIDPDIYRKSNYKFLPANHSSIAIQGTTERKSDHIICQGDNWVVCVNVPGGVREVLPILGRHKWSGVVQLSVNFHSLICDLYWWCNYVQPVRLLCNENSSIDECVSIIPIGKNLASFSSECVIYGVLYR